MDADVEECVDEEGGGVPAVAGHGARQERLEEGRVGHADQEDGVEGQRHHRVQLGRKHTLVANFIWMNTLNSFNPSQLLRLTFTLLRHIFRDSEFQTQKKHFPAFC